MNPLIQMTHAFSLGNPTLAAQIALKTDPSSLGSILPPLSTPTISGLDPRQALAIALKGTSPSVLAAHAGNLRKSAQVPEAFGSDIPLLKKRLRAIMRAHEGPNHLIRKPLNDFYALFDANPHAVLDVLFDMMKEKNHGVIADMAPGFAASLVEKSPLVFQRIIEEWPRVREAASRMLVMLRENPRALVTLEHLVLAYPEDSQYLKNIRLRHFTRVRVLNRKPLNGRREFLVAAVSDIHHSDHTADFTRDIASRLRDIQPDILIIAGDLAESVNYFREALELLRGAWDTLVLPGNHDVRSAWRMHLRRYGPMKHADGIGLPTSQDLWDEVLPDLVRAAGAVWLEREAVLVPRARLGLGGTIGWYDYRGDDRKLSREHLGDPEIKGRFTRDGSFVDWEWDDITFAAGRRHWLSAALAFLSGLPEAERILVATHVPPFNGLKPPELFSGPHAPYFSGRAPYYFVPSLGETIARYPKVSHTVSGHFHVGHETRIKRGNRPPIEAAILAQSGPSTPKQGNEIRVYRFEDTRGAFTSY